MCVYVCGGGLFRSWNQDWDWMLGVASTKVSLVYACRRGGRGIIVCDYR
jgi:hypothetical protein